MAWEVIIVTTCLVLYTHGAERVDVQERVMEVLAKRSSLLPDHDETTQGPLSVMMGLPKSEAVEPEDSVEIKPGSRIEKFGLYYKGIKVYDSIITATQDEKTGDYTGDITGTFLAGIERDVPDVTPEITGNEALFKVRRLQGDVGDDVRVSNEKVEKMIFLDNKGRARLVYLVTYFSMSSKVDRSGVKNRKFGPSKPKAFVDAMTGEVLESWEDLTTIEYKSPGVGGNEKVGKYKYGTDYDLLTMTKISETRCIMETPYLKVVHLNGRETSDDAPLEVDCTTGAIDEGKGAYSPANDALFYGKTVLDMYLKWYQFHPLNGSKLTLRVHYGSNIDSAYFDGTAAMNFGDGDVLFYPLVSLDVTGHEISHGLTKTHSDLEYKGESGGMNEAFSDMAGETVEFYLREQNDWLLAYDVYKNGSLRYIYDPPKDGHSIDSFKDFKLGMDPHYSSGVYNKAFYNLVKSDGWNIKDAFHVFLLANRIYWHATSGFIDGACGAERAAADLGFKTADIKNAFETVGVETCMDYSPFKEVINGEEVTVIHDKILKYKFVLPPFTRAFTCSLKNGVGTATLYGRNRYIPSPKYHQYTQSLDLSQSSFTVSQTGNYPYYFAIHPENELTGSVKMVCRVHPVEELKNGEKIDDLESSGRPFYFLVKITGKAKNLKITMLGGEGDADMYVQYGDHYPSLSEYDFRPFRYNSSETVAITHPLGGTYRIMINPASPYDDVSIACDFTEMTGKPHTKPPHQPTPSPTKTMKITPLQNGVVKTGLSINRKDKFLYFKLNVPKGAKNLNFHIWGGYGDADILVRFGNVPTTEDFDFRPWKDGSNETVFVEKPEDGTWYVMLEGYKAFGGLNLEASFEISDVLGLKIPQENTRKLKRDMLMLYKIND